MYLAEIAYALCAFTCTMLAVVLWRTYLRTEERFLLWCTFCFTGLAMNNAMIFVDVVLYPGIDLAVVRTLPAVLGFGCLIYGFIWDVA